MKKILFLLASSFFLVGCANTQQSGNSDKPVESSSISSSSESSTSESGSEESTSLTPDDFIVYEISTSDATWGSTFAKRAGFVDSGTTNNSNNRENLRQYLDASHSVINSLDCTGAITNIDYGEQSQSLALCIGGGSSLGSITFNCSKTLYSINMEIQSYYKTYTTYEGDPYNGLSLDTNSQFEIKANGSGARWSLETTQSEGPKTLSIYNEPKSKTVTIKNYSDDHGRVLIKSMRLAFLK